MNARSLALALILPALAVAMGVAPAPLPAGERLSVHVSVAPLQWLVDELGAGRIASHTLVGPGSSPATYDPTPRQIAALASSRVYFRVGVPFERAWMPRIRAASPDMQVVDLREAVELRAMEHSHDHGGAASGSDAALDPHVWTSPPNLIAMARLVRDHLSELDPEGEAAYSERFRALEARLQDLHRELERLTARAEPRRLLVFHPSWGYFADAYGLEQVAVEQEGKAPGARALAHRIEEARAAGVQTVFVQPQFSQRAAGSLAEAIGAQLVVVDPLAYDVPGALLRMARRIAGDPE